MDFPSDEKNSPPHTQKSQMATELTSTEIREDTVSKITSSAMAVDIAVQPIEGASDVSGPHDDMMDQLNNSLANNSSGSIPTAAVGTLAVLKNKKKHRRGKPKKKNTKPYKKTNWKFQVPRNGKSQNKATGGYMAGGSGSKSYTNSMNARRPKLNRSRSLVPYNTNKFLMEEHLAEMPSVLLTPSTHNGRTRDSSFSVDSEDNYLYSLPEDEEEFLTKEFSNVYERARVERLEMLTKQQLIAECLQIEDRYSEQGAQGQQQVNVQKMSADFLAKIRQMEEKIRDLTRENNELRRQLATITAKTQNPTPMDSSSEDSESDSSSSSDTSKSSSSRSSLSQYSASGDQKPPDEMIFDTTSSSEDTREIVNAVTEWNNYCDPIKCASETPTSSSSSPSRCSLGQDHGINGERAIGKIPFDTSSSSGGDFAPQIDTEWNDYGTNKSAAETNGINGEKSPNKMVLDASSSRANADQKIELTSHSNAITGCVEPETDYVTNCNGYLSPGSHYHTSLSSPTSPGPHQESVCLSNSHSTREKTVAETDSSRPM